jgi:hypothetical protein
MGISEAVAWIREQMSINPKIHGYSISGNKLIVYAEPDVVLPVSVEGVDVVVVRTSQFGVR